MICVSEKMICFLAHLVTAVFHIKLSSLNQWHGFCGLNLCYPLDGPLEGVCSSD